MGLWLGVELCHYTQHMSRNCRDLACSVHVVIFIGKYPRRYDVSIMSLRNYGLKLLVCLASRDCRLITHSLCFQGETTQMQFSR